MRFVRFSIAVALLTALAISGLVVFADTGKKPDKQAAMRGEKLYATYCQACHQKDGVGEPLIPWGIRRPGYFSAPALDDSQNAWHHTDDNLVKTILEGSPRSKRKPARKDVLSEKDARDIVAYIKSLWGPRALACQGPKHMSCPPESKPAR